MPSWGQVLRELQSTPGPGALDAVRRKYLQALCVKTGRNVIAYYSGWLRYPNVYGTQITDDDKTCL